MVNDGRVKHYLSLLSCALNKIYWKMYCAERRPLSSKSQSFPYHRNRLRSWRSSLKNFWALLKPWRFHPVSFIVDVLYALISSWLKYWNQELMVSLRQSVQILLFVKNWTCHLLLRDTEIKSIAISVSVPAHARAYYGMRLLTITSSILCRYQHMVCCDPWESIFVEKYYYPFSLANVFAGRVHRDRDNLLFCRSRQLTVGEVFHSTVISVALVIVIQL